MKRKLSHISVFTGEALDCSFLDLEAEFTLKIL